MTKQAIAITLSKKALITLDELMGESGLESRSRTIEETILAIADIKEYYIQLFHMSKKCKHGLTTINSEGVPPMLNAMEVILGRLSGFKQRKKMKQDKMNKK
ncbi:MAG TPA: hypothetical protein VI968_02145 [archaeon]|nr:hypothetical protein [archaeon]